MLCWNRGHSADFEAAMRAPASGGRAVVARWLAALEIKVQRRGVAVLQHVRVVVLPGLPTVLRAEQAQRECRRAQARTSRSVQGLALRLQ